MQFNVPTHTKGTSIYHRTKIHCIQISIIIINHIKYFYLLFIVGEKRKQYETIHCTKNKFNFLKGCFSYKNN